jgi:YVTN family beta-propeller protein
VRIAAFTAAVVASAAVAIPLALGHGGRTVVPVPNSIVRIDPRTNKIVQDIHVGREPSGIAATREAVWVANERDRTLSRFDTHTHAIQTIGGLNGVGFVTRDAHGNVYASGWDYPFVWRIDPRAVALAATYRIRSRAVGMAVGGGSLWVVDRLVNSVARIDLRHDKVADSIKVGADPLVTTFGFGALWVANSDDATVSVVRPGTRATQTIAVGAKPFGIAAGEGAVWVSSNSDATLTRIDPELGRVTKVIHMPAQPDAVYNVAVGAGSVWVADVFGLQVIRIDPHTNKVVARIKLGVEPRVIAASGDNVWVSVAPPGTTG